MNNSINITLDDVKDFLSAVGHTWNGNVIINDETTKATSLNDFKYARTLTAMKLHNNQDEKEIKDVVITPTSFIFYQQTFDHSDIDATFEYEVETDYTELWVKFLLKKYGNNYKDYVKKLCKIMRQQEVNKAKYEFDRIKEIKKDIIRKLKVKLNFYQKLEDLVDNVYELKK
ncbi:MAG: hypothetical protein ACLRFE_02385 [Clostridia bacterium]